MTKDQPEYEYWRTKTSYHIWEVIKNRWLKGRKLKIDFIAKPAELGGDNEARIIERWTDETTAELREIGHYKKVIGWKDSIVFAGVQCYIKIRNLEKFDQDVLDSNGCRIYSEDSASTLHDVITSNNIMQAIRNMAKVAMSKMDIQTMVLIAIIGVGAVVGMHFLGVF